MSIMLGFVVVLKVGIKGCKVDVTDKKWQMDNSNCTIESSVSSNDSQIIGRLRIPLRQAFLYGRQLVFIVIH